MLPRSAAAAVLDAIEQAVQGRRVVRGVAAEVLATTLLLRSGPTTTAAARGRPGWPPPVG